MIKTTLTDTDFKIFWLKLYFNLNDGFLPAAINRAYRDFNRTIKKIPPSENDRKPIRQNWIEGLKVKIEQLLTTEFKNQLEFDTWHRSACEILCQDNNGVKLKIGQAQKWVNMTLKYSFLMGEENIHGIEKNYRFFHIPIDGIILCALKSEHNLNIIHKEFSKISSYDLYNNYQIAVRNIFSGQIPMDEEFKLFNNFYQI